MFEAQSFIDILLKIQPFLNNADTQPKLAPSPELFDFFKKRVTDGRDRRSDAWTDILTSSQPSFMGKKGDGYWMRDYFQ